MILKRRSKHALTGAASALMNVQALTTRMEYEIYSFWASWNTLLNSFKRPALCMYFDSCKELKYLLETLDRKALQKYWFRKANNFT